MPELSPLVASERHRDIARAVRELQAKLTKGAVPAAGRAGAMWSGPDQSFWFLLGRTRTNTHKGWRFWNAFGRTPGKIILEVNPAMSGVPNGVQGVVAVDRGGRRWLLHGGRIHPGRVRVSKEEFGAVSNLPTRTVSFSDGSRSEYFPVADLDASRPEILASISRFVAKCEQVRMHHIGGEQEAAIEGRVAEAEQDSGAEDGSRPEGIGTFSIPARAASTGDREHGLVWRALATALDREGIRHSNARVGAYGPDLRTLDGERLLFEIKTSNRPGSIYEGLGQLLMYGAYLGTPHRKVLVLPQRPTAMAHDALAALGIEIVEYTRSGQRVMFPDIGRVLMSAPAKQH